MIKAMIRCVAALAVTCTCLWSAEAYGQDNAWTGGVGGNWTGGTWTFFTPPDPSLDNRGIVGSTVGSASPTGEVNINSDIRVSFPSPTVVLGLDGGTSGTMNIGASGAFHVQAGGAAGSSGDFEVGLNGGLGVLNVQGILEVAAQLSSATNADPDSTIMLSGSAKVSAGSGFLDNNLIVDGSSVVFSFTNDLILGQNAVHEWRIPASGASTIAVGGNADLGGTLKLEFPNGTPSFGTIWNLIDSTSVDDGEAIASGFDTIDQSAVLGLPFGGNFVVNSVPGGSNGTLSQLSLEQHPVLVVDRATGMAKIQNFNPTTATVNFDVYTIGSALGSLSPGGWTSIAPANGWVEASPSSTALSEVIPNPGASDSIAASTSVSLGTPVVFPTPSTFGEENEDITFRFGKAGDAVFTEGRVIYEGIPNNTLTLNVDPDTGEAQIVNGTAFTVSIDTYVISSPNAMLNSADGNPVDTWNSLEDQGESGGLWFESNTSDEQISELLVSGGLELAPDATISLGAPFNDSLGALEGDLVFQFALVGEESRGDYNDNGVLDAADYVAWRYAFPGGALVNDDDGLADEGDYAYWRGHFGETVPRSAEMLTGKVVYSELVEFGGGALASAAVPEPGSGTMALICLSTSALVASGRRR